MDDNPDVILKTETLTFSYHNIAYSSPYYYAEDSIVVLNNSVREVFNKIMSNENRYTLIKDSITMFFDSVEEYQNYSKNDSLSLILRNSRAGEDGEQFFEIKAEFANHIPATGAAKRNLTIISRHKFIVGQNVTTPIREIPDLRVYGLEDRISWACITLSLYDMIPSADFRGTTYYTLFLGYNFEGKDTGLGNEALVRYNPQNPLIQEGRPTYRSQFKTTHFTLRDPISGEIYNDRAKSIKVGATYSYNDDREPGRSEGGRNPKEDNDPTYGGRVPSKN